MNRIVNQCLNAYIICSNDLPTEVIILKNGTAKNELSLLLTSEIKDAKAAVSNITKDSFKPNLSYIVVDCNSNQKFFLDKNKEIMNPSYGTLINS